MGYCPYATSLSRAAPVWNPRRSDAVDWAWRDACAGAKGKLRAREVDISSTAKTENTTQAPDARDLKIQGLACFSSYHASFHTPVPDPCQIRSIQVTLRPAWFAD